MKNQFLLFCIASLYISCQSNDFVPTKGDVLVANGTILTINEEFDIASSMVIRNDQIVYVGKDLEPTGFDPDLIIDLNGKTAMPGLIEPHTHPIASAILYNWLDVSGFTHNTAEDALNAIRQAAQNVPDGQWILAFGWDAMLLKESFPPYREVLDEISDKHPIWVMMQSMHSHYFNSYALNLAGIKDNIQNPPQGGFYEKDEHGKLTGLITESVTLAPFLPTLPRFGEDIQKALIQKQFAEYNSEGITTIGITGLIDGLMPNAENHLQNISESGNSNLRVFLYRDGAQKGHIEKPTSENEFFRYLGNKYWSDGSPYTGTMLLKEPYITSELNQDKLSIKKNTFGHSILSDDNFRKFTMRDAKGNLQISIHAQGDSAIDNTLAIYKNILEQHQNSDHRHRMEHLALIKESHIKEMAQLGITPSFHINHIHYYGDFLARIVGAERANQFMPIGLTEKYNMKFSLHNDSPMYPPKPFLAAQSAITRKTLNGRSLGPSYAISIEEALRAITIYPAWQMFADKEIGSLEVGKKADIIILDQNPLECNPEKIKDISILEVRVNGVQTFKKN